MRAPLLLLGATIEWHTKHWDLYSFWNFSRSNSSTKSSTPAVIEDEETWFCVCGGWGWEGERLIYGFPFEGRHAWINQSCCRKRESGNTKLLVVVCVSASPLSCDWGMGRLVGAKRRGRGRVSLWKRTLSILLLSVGFS